MRQAVKLRNGASNIYHLYIYINNLVNLWAEVRNLATFSISCVMRSSKIPQ